KIDVLLQSSHPMRSDLAMIYLLVLGLGFEGQFKGMEETGRLEWYRIELYKIIHKERPPLFEPLSQVLQSDCYRNTITEPIVRHLPDIRFWVVIFALAIAAYIFASIAIWYDATQPVDAAINRIFDQARAMIL